VPRTKHFSCPYVQLKAHHKQSLTTLYLTFAVTSETSTSPASDQTPTISSQSSSKDVPSQTISSLDSDAPLLAFLKRYPRGFSTIEEGQKFVKELQTLRLVAPTLKAKLAEESGEIAKRQPAVKRIRVERKPMSADDILGSI